MTSMKRCSKCGQVKLFSDFCGHRRMKGGRYSRCKVCKSEDAKAYRAANLKLVRGRSLQWYENNREKALTNTKLWRTRNPEKTPAAWKRWSRANHQHLVDYRKRNAWRQLAHVRTRQASKLKATPEWANRFFMEEAYHLARIRTDMLGFPWDVDHIVPLKNPIVCGLHVEHNLQVIPELENIKKGNRRWPDMPDVQGAFER